VKSIPYSKQLADRSDCAIFADTNYLYFQRDLIMRVHRSESIGGGTGGAAWA